MAVKDLEARQGKVNLELEIIDKEDAREFEKFGKKGRVCNATAKDATGTIKLTLWNDDVDKVNVGDTVKIENGWVGEWQGELQLSTGKFGKMEVLSSGGSSAGSADMSTDKSEHIVTEDEKVEEEVLDTLDEEPVVEEDISDDEKKGL